MSSTCVFRADADSSIGSGHFIRSLSLAAEWQNQGQRAVIAGSAPSELIRRAHDLGVEHLALANSDSLGDDARGLIDHCSRLTAQILCIDDYRFDPAYVSKIRDSGLLILEFSDGPIWSGYLSDLLLDQNLGAEDQSYEVASWTLPLQGVKYACLAPQFRALAGVPRIISERVTKILVSMGGADPRDATTAVLSAILELGESMEVTVTIGASNPRKGAISKLASGRPNVEVLFDATNMAELMRTTDIAIAAAGSTSWELVAMGVPALLTTVADNQLRIADQLDKAGAAINLGSVDDLTTELLLKELTRLMEDRQRRALMSRKGQELVDGKGAARVVARMLELVGESE